MSKYALIDVGSRTVKLSVFSVENKKIELIFSDQATVNLAESFYPALTLQDEALKRTVARVVEMVKQIAELKVDRIQIVSTGVARKAKNSDLLIKGIQQATGEVLEIISGEKEAELFYHGVVNDFKDSLYFAAINIGGGSSEITFGTKEKIDHLFSLGVGVSALNEEFLKTDPPTDQEHAVMLSRIRKEIENAELPGVKENTVLIHTGGELDYMEKTCYSLADSDLSPSHPKQIMLEDFVGRSEEIRLMTKEQLHEFMPENPYWMEGAIACNAIARCIAEHLGINCIVPSNKNLNDGLLYDLVKKETKV